MFNRLKEIIFSSNFTGFSVTGVKAVLAEKITGYEKHVHEGPETEELKDAIRNQSKPVVRSRRKEIESKARSGTTFDSIRVELDNNGDGIAENLYVRPALSVSYERDLDPTVHKLIDIEEACFIGEDGQHTIEFVPKCAPLTRVEGDFTENHSVQGGVLSVNERGVEFSGQIEFQSVTYDGDRISWGRVPVLEAMGELHDAGIRDMWFEVHLLFTDSNGRVHAEQLLGRSGSLTGALTFEDIAAFDFSTETSSNDRVLSKVEDSMKYPP